MTPKISPSACVVGAPDLFTGEAPIERSHGDNAMLSVSEQEEPTTGGVLSRSMSLFEIDESLSALMESAVEAAAENNGEIPAKLHQALVDYCEAFGQKVDNMARYIRSQEFEAKEREGRHRTAGTKEGCGTAPGRTAEGAREVLHGEPQYPVNERRPQHDFAAEE
jgi:hypothetical protein